MLRTISRVNVNKIGARSLSSSSITNLKELDKSNRFNLGIQIVPNQEARVVEWFGKFNKVLTPGIHFLIPFVQRVSYTHSLKERMLRVEPQMCWTKDNVQVFINGNVFVQVEDPVKASYAVEQPYSMIYQMAFSTMRAEVGLLELDELLNNRDQINDAISTSIEGERQVLINRSEGEMQAITNKAKAEADAKVMIAEAEATAIRKVTEELNKEAAGETARYNIAQEMAKAWGKMAGNSPTILLPQDAGNISSLVSQAFATYDRIKKN